MNHVWMSFGDLMWCYACVGINAIFSVVWGHIKMFFRRKWMQKCFGALKHEAEDGKDERTKNEQDGLKERVEETEKERVTERWRKGEKE